MLFPIVSANEIIVDDFEDGDIAGWTVEVDSGCSVDITSTVTLEGDYSVNSSMSTFVNNALMYQIVDTDRGFARILLNATAFNSIDTRSIWYLRFMRQAQPDIARLGVVNTGGVYQWQIASYNATSAAYEYRTLTTDNPQINTLYSISLYAVASDTVGEAKFYLGDVEMLSITGVNNTQGLFTTFNKLYVGQFTDGNGVNSTAIIDNVVVDDQHYTRADRTTMQPNYKWNRGWGRAPSDTLFTDDAEGNFTNRITFQVMWDGPTAGEVYDEELISITETSHNGRYAYNFTRISDGGWQAPKLRGQHAYQDVELDYVGGWVQLRKGFPKYNLMILKIGGLSYYEVAATIDNSTGTACWGMKYRNETGEYYTYNVSNPVSLNTWYWVVAGGNRSDSGWNSVWIDDVLICNEPLNGTATNTQYMRSEYGIESSSGSEDQGFDVLIDEMVEDRGNYPTMYLADYEPEDQPQSLGHRINTTVAGRDAEIWSDWEVTTGTLHGSIVETNTTGVLTNSTWTSTFNESNVGPTWGRVKGLFTLNSNVGKVIAVTVYVNSSAGNWEILGPLYFTTTTPSGSTSSLYTEGRYIKQVGTGDVVNLTGQNNGWMLDGTSGSWVTWGNTEGAQLYSELAVNQTLDHIKLWGENHLRLMINVEYWLGTAGYREKVENITRLADERDMYIVFAPWSVSVAGGQAPVPYPPTSGATNFDLIDSVDDWLDFLENVTLTLKAYDNVIFNLHNEPQVSSIYRATSGINGTVTFDYDNERWFMISQLAIDRIRQYSDMPIVVELGYGADLLWVAFSNLHGSNIIYSGHIYSNNNFDGEVARTKAQVLTHLTSDHYPNVTQTWNKPMYVGEWGYNEWESGDREGEGLKWKYALEYLYDWGASWSRWSYRGTGTQWDTLNGSMHPQDMRQPMGRHEMNITTYPNYRSWVVSAGTASIDDKENGAYYRDDISYSGESWTDSNNTLRVTVGSGSGYLYVFPSEIPTVMFYTYLNGINGTFGNATALYETDNYLLDIPISGDETIEVFNDYWYPSTKKDTNVGYNTSGLPYLIDTSNVITDIYNPGNDTLRIKTYVPTGELNLMDVYCSVNGTPTSIKYGNGTSIDFDYNTTTKLCSFDVQGASERTIIMSWIAQGNQAPNAPTLTSPANNTRYDTSELVTFSWTFSDPDGGDTQGAYQIQMDNDQNFGSIDFDSNKVSSSSETTDRNIPSSIDKYFWRVKTWDQDDAEGSWSSTVRCVIVDRVKVLDINANDTSPAVDETVELNATLVYEYDSTEITTGTFTLEEQSLSHITSGIWTMTDSKSENITVVYNTVAGSVGEVSGVNMNEQSETVIWGTGTPPNPDDDVVQDFINRTYLPAVDMFGVVLIIIAAVLIFSAMNEIPIDINLIVQAVLVTIILSMGIYIFSYFRF